MSFHMCVNGELVANQLPLISAVDVYYKEPIAVAACVQFRGWAADAAVFETTTKLASLAHYESGQFYRRELPCILRVLQACESASDIVIVDGYVWLDAHQKPGLGAHLFDAIDKRAAVVGVAKTSFAGATAAKAIFRGGSRSALYVSAVGMSVSDAVAGIVRMHGNYRMPTLLKRVDRLCRGSALAELPTIKSFDGPN
jgi:deoxyribonuclease V